MKSSSTYTNHSLLLKFLILILSFALVFTLASCGGSQEPAPDSQEEAVQEEPAPEPEPDPDVITNLLTGEIGPQSTSIKTRVVGIVVENHPAARPQWGMDDEKHSPDIILEGEVEGGITRMFWMWADYNNLPEIVGPVRSARPPFIKFSELYNAIFVHWGMSHTDENYYGADSVFKEDKVPHLNGMNYERKAPYDRMQGTGRAIEHTGIVYGDQLPKTLDEKFKMELKADKTTQLSFYEDKQARGDSESCYQLTLKFSNIGGKTIWEYNEEDQKYHSSSFENDVARDNLIILFDETNYITKPGYTTYCNYNFKGGNAYIASCGSFEKVKWRVKDGKLQLYRKITETQADGTEKTSREEVSINPGKSYIGWASYNNNGKCTIKSKADLAA